MSDATTAASSGAAPSSAAAGSSPHITKENIDDFDYFALFGLSVLVEGAANADIDVAAVRRVYRRLSLRFHPDKDDTEAARHAFEVVHTALETIIDAAKREAYIRSLTDAQGGATAKPDTGEEVRQRQRTQQAQDEALWAAAELQQREQQRRAREEAARQAAQEREAAAQRLLAELTGSLNTPFQQMEAELVREWDVDEDMVAAKTREVMQLLEKLAPVGSGSVDGGASRKRDREAAEGM